jgi:hypothetical protein
MDIAKVIADLRARRQAIDSAIASLENLALLNGVTRNRSNVSALSMPKRRGRPPGSRNKPKEIAIAASS